MARITHDAVYVLRYERAMGGWTCVPLPSSRYQGAMIVYKQDGTTTALMHAVRDTLECECDATMVLDEFALRDVRIGLADGTDWTLPTDVPFQRDIGVHAPPSSMPLAVQRACQWFAQVFKLPEGARYTVAYDASTEKWSAEVDVGPSGQAVLYMPASFHPSRVQPFADAMMGEKWLGDRDLMFTLTNEGITQFSYRMDNGSMSSDSEYFFSY